MGIFSAAYALLLLGAAQLPAAAPPEPSQRIALDLDNDGLIDRASVSMRPHSMRLDVEIVLAKQEHETINVIAVKQPPTGPLVYAKLSPARPGRFAYDCRRVENRDSTPCEAGVVELALPGIEVITPGQPNLLIWLEAGRPAVVRLADDRAGVAAGAVQQRAHVLFIAPAGSGRAIIEASEQVRDRLDLPWLAKGIAPLSPRWFQRCPHAGKMDAIETCVRTVWRERQARETGRVMLVLAAARGARTMSWRCLGDRGSARAELGTQRRLRPADLQAAGRCLDAVIADQPPGKTR